MGYTLKSTMGNFEFKPQKPFHILKFSYFAFTKPFEGTPSQPHLLRNELVVHQGFFLSNLYHAQLKSTTKLIVMYSHILHLFTKLLKGMRLN